jgi:protein gp37
VNKTSIEWTDETWAPVVHPERLTVPLKWRKPRRVLVSDLFHEDVPDEFLDRVFAVMALTPQHTYQVLTKRPERMRAYLTWRDNHRVLNRRGAIQNQLDFQSTQPRTVIADWPLPNVWLGTSVENQEAADERIPHLLATPAAVHYLSCEPLLGPVTLDGRVLGRRCECPHDYYPFVPGKGYQHYAECRAAETKGWVLSPSSSYRLAPNARIDWVIVGGESGPGARPCDLGWIRDVVAQCKAAGVPAFVKQLGSKPVSFGTENEPGIGGIRRISTYRQRWDYRLRDRKGGDMSEWPEDLRVREWPS